MVAVGSVVISVDAELGWGFHDLPGPPTERVEAGRRGWRRLLELFGDHELPATWAVVGHLLLEECDGHHRSHPAGPEWFARERTDWRDRPELRFGRELVTAVLEGPVEHEVGSHSFSHVLFGETSREVARAELHRSRELAAAAELPFDSFVYPRNDVGHRDVLAEHGIVAYRGETPTPEGIRAVVAGELGRSLLVEPHVDEYGLVNVPASLFAFGFEGAARRATERLWDDPMVRLARRGVDEAVDGDGVFHLWLHPNNLVDAADDRRMDAILAHVARRRAETELTVETMGAVGRRVLAARGTAAGATV